MRVFYLLFLFQELGHYPEGLDLPKLCYAHGTRTVGFTRSQGHFYAPATHIVLPLSVRTYIRTSFTFFSTVLVTATPPKVFDAGT